ncbi:hypothetical protein ACQJBY_013724 [Aegilops geniculata]
MAIAVYNITRYYGAPMENTRLDFQKLYLRRIFSGENSNQAQIIDGHAHTASPFATTSVYNWAIYDGTGAGASIVARAKGIHVDVDNWYISFVMVFDTERFRFRVGQSMVPSTLAITGTSLAEPSEWAIVGGTGYFAMARGVIKKTVYVNPFIFKNDCEQVQELTIEAFCRTQPQPAARIEPPHGSENAGIVRDITELPQYLESVTITTGGVIDAFTFSYIDQAGGRQTVGPWGAGGPTDAVTTTIRMRPSEFVRAIHGTWGKIDPTASEIIVITSLTIVTNLQTYGPIGDPNYMGKENNTAFSIEVPPNRGIMGFYGRSERYLNAIGVYAMDLGLVQ